MVRVAIAAALLVWLASGASHADEMTSGLREVESPAHLWIEGEELVTTAGRRLPPRPILFAACDPYYVDVTEIGPLAKDEQTSLYRVRVPRFRGLFRATQRVGAPLRVEVQKIRYNPHGAPEERYDVWTPQLRHFFDPRYNSLAVLNQRATFERFSTGTVATYWLTSGRRAFVFDAAGILREKHAGAKAPGRAPVGGVLLLEDYCDDPFFPRRLVHKRWEGDGALMQMTTWNLSIVRKVSRAEELMEALPLWGELVLCDVATQTTAALPAMSDRRDVLKRLRIRESESF